MGKKAGIEARIREHYKNLTPAETRLADLLTHLPGTPAGYTATELARLAGVSKAIATRFFRTLGYRDFGAFREELRGIETWGSPAYQDVVAPEVAVDEHLRPHLQRELRNLARTFGGLTPHVLDQSAEAIRTAEHVYLCGFRNSHLLAAYLARQLILMRSNVVLLPSTGQTLGDDLVSVQEGDLLVIVGLRRRVPEMYKIMAVARDRGATILYLTDPSSRRSRKLADWVIDCDLQGAPPFDSYAATTCLLNLLCAEVFRHDIEGGYQRLREIEALHDVLGELGKSS